jgi:glycogen operon protein
MLTLLLVAEGTPMLTMGDEARRTQQGNNNAYCQDNEVSWFDWTLVERHRGLHRFVKSLLAFRSKRDVVVGRMRLTLNELLRRAPIEWHGVELRRPDWGDQSHSLGFTLTSLGGHFKMHGMLNAYWEPLRFQLPLGIPEKGGAWRRWIDTSLDSPEDIVDWDRAPRITETTYLVPPRTVVFLVMPLAADH